jgi:hypothetical protein
MKKINKNQDFIKISKNDKQYKYIGKWPILYLDISDENGIWTIFQNKINDLKNNGELQEISNDMIEKFFYKRSEIQFEVDFFLNTMKKCIFFKYKNKMYCYTISGTSKKDKNKIFCRLYFDANKVLSLNLPIKFC